jgi:molecular chaperone DnaK
MTRITIDFGIDLGTTNSAIAVLQGAKPEIIKNERSMDITPSAVYIGRQGTMHIGILAKNAVVDPSKVDDVHFEFKRFMGKDKKFEFTTAKRSMRAEELSAEILKSLCGDAHAQGRFGEVVAAAITVPAAFEQNQCAATKRAGELAGLIQCPLLQEPVAAALAYGFQADVTKELWLVYDFGGGTFDAAIIRAEEGNISVVNHGGDNDLGGSDIDWAILERLVFPELQSNYDLPDFQRANKKWRTQLAKLKSFVEDAKISLSRVDKANLEGCQITDAGGNTIDVDIELRRDDVINIAEPIIMRSIDICKRVLKEKNLDSNAIAKMILVGGPTLAPYFREILSSSLNIQVDNSVDPLTVVARGAAVFAGTQRLEGKAAPKATAGQYNIELKYKPIAAEEDFTLRGIVSSHAGTSVEGFTVEFVNQNSHWRSGKSAIKPDGKFRAKLLAEKGCRNIYLIELLDAKGRIQVVVPDQMPYTVSSVGGISAQPITHSISVALANNETEVYFTKGDPLPAKATRQLHTMHAIKKGTSDILRCPVVEGELERADRNKLLGTLIVSGSQCKRDLPVGSDVEVTLILDASQVLTAKAYIPMLDEEYEARIKRNEKSADPERLKRELHEETVRLRALQEKARDVEEEEIEEVLDEVETSAKVKEISSMMAASANKAEKRLLELKIELDAAEDAMLWPGLVKEALEKLEGLESLIAECGTSEHAVQAETLRTQVEESISQKRADRLRLVQARVFALAHEILFEQPSYWVGMFKYLEGERSEMSDQGTVDKLLNQGRACIDQENLQGLMNVVRQLWELIPTEVSEVIRRGYDSSLLR